MGEYRVHRVKIGKTPQLDALAQECGRLYSQVVVSFWRTVRHQGIWLKPSHLMRWHTSTKLHAHTADACIQAFFASLKSWRERKKAGDPDVKPPHKRKRYFRIEYKRSAMARKSGMLRLSNGKGNAPLVLPWPWELPNTLIIHWTGTQYEAIATYVAGIQAQPQGEKVAGIDLGEVHMAAAHDGTETHILNGRLLRSKVQYRNKLQATLNSRIDGKMKKGSKRRKRVIHSKKKQLKKIEHQIREIEHKQTSRLITTLYEAGVRMLVIGDVRAIRQRTDVGSKNNQKIHQWSHGRVRFLLTYKAEQVGLEVVLQEEAHTSRTCPRCGHRRKSKVQGRVFRCTNKRCKFAWHRDGVGAVNIRSKYRGEFGVPHVVGVMAPPSGLRFMPQAAVARVEREAVGL
jgi:putative transposase